MSEDWARALRFGVLRLGLEPAAFWGLTLLEWRMLTSDADHGLQPLSHSEMARLLDRFPIYKKRTE